MAKRLLTKPYEKNAKKHPDAQLKQIALSLKEYGWRQPVVVDKEGTIIVGHGRMLAYEKYPEGIKEPWIEVAKDLTPEQVRGYRLMDNKTNESDWDMALAIEELKELDTLGFDIDLTGFDKDLLIESDEKDDVIPENPPPIAKLGDLWALGEHRVLCGDSTNSESVARLMDGKKADMVFTDPPYNVNYSGRGVETSNTIENDNMSEGAFDEFLSAAFDSYKTAVKISAPFYVCYSSSSQIIFEGAMAKTDLRVKNQIIWNKTVASMGWGDYRWKHEPIFYATYGKKATQFYGDRSEYTVWDESWSLEKIKNNLKRIAVKLDKGGSTVWKIGRDSNYKHPTQKPIELITIALANSSKQDDIILDLFLGSGSTLIAAEKTGRICYGMEIDPKYVDVILKRWEDYTGLTAQKL